MTRPLIALAIASSTALALGVLCLPTELDVQRSAVVHGTPAEVAHLAAHYPDRLGWVPWTEQDPEAVYTFTGTPGKPGATMSWVGTEIGDATLTLERVVPGREVVSRLEYTAPFEMTTTDRFVLEDLGDGTTQVTWSSTGPLALGPDRLFGLFADGMLGPDYEHGLTRLDALLADDRS